MNTQMTERFNVAGAMLVKLFGDERIESSEFPDRAGQVRDIGIKSAMYGRVFFVALGLVAAMGAAAVYGVGALMVIDGTITVGTLVAMAAYATRLYGPLTSLTNTRVDVMTALVSFERVFEVLDAPVAIQDRPGRRRPDLAGRPHRARPRLVPLPAGLRGVDRLARDPPERRRRRSVGAGVPSRRPAGSELVEVLHDVSLSIEPGQMVALVGPVGRGQDHAGVADPPPLRRHRRRREDRRLGRARPHPALAAGGHRRGGPGPAPVPRVGGLEPALRPARGHRSPRWRRRAAAPRSTT